MASYTSLSFSIVRLDRLQTILNDYWRVTVAVLGLSTVVLVNVPSNTVSQHGVASLLEFFGAVGTSVLSSPVQSLALLAVGVCLLPSTTFVLTGLTAQPACQPAGAPCADGAANGNERRIFSIPIICKLGSHDIHVEADCSSPLAPPSVRIHRLGHSPASFDLAIGRLPGHGPLNPRRLSFEELVALPAAHPPRQSPFFPCFSSAPTTPSAHPTPTPFNTPPAPQPSHPHPPSLPTAPHTRLHPAALDHQWALDSPRSVSEPPASPAHPTGRRSGRSLDEPQPPMAGLGLGGRWQPSMQRIVSGQDLLALATPLPPTPPRSTPGTAAPTHPNLPPSPPLLLLPAPAPTAPPPPTAQPGSGDSGEPSAVAELQQWESALPEPAWLKFVHPLPDPCPPGDDAVAARELAAAAGPAPGTDLHTVVRDEHLLQLAALLGEPSAQHAIQQGDAPPPVGDNEACLLGAPEDRTLDAEWELLTDHDVPGRVRHQGWRRSLRCGLYLYKSLTVFEGISPAQLRAFQHDDTQRADWDDNTLALAHLPPLSTTPTPLAQPPPSAPESTYLYCRTRFPKPLAAREYVYARRVWPRASDGGCYSVSRACAHAAHPGPSGRGVAVSDFASGYIIRAAPQAQPPAGAPAAAAPAAELVSLYFEDPHVRAGIMNLAVKKGMWDAVKRNEALLRQHVLEASARDIVRASAAAATTLAAFPLPDAAADDAEADAEGAADAAAAAAAPLAQPQALALTTAVMASPAVSWLRSWYPGAGSSSATTTSVAAAALPALASCPLPHATSTPLLAPAAASSCRAPLSTPLPPVVSFPLAMRDASIDAMEEAMAAAAALQTSGCREGHQGAGPAAGRCRPLRSHALLQGSHALALRRHAARLHDAGLAAAEQLLPRAAIGAATRHVHAAYRVARAHSALLRRRRRTARVEWVQRALKAVKVVAGLKLMHQVINPAPGARMLRRAQVV